MTGNACDSEGRTRFTHLVPPGETCDGCGRKVPHPKKPTSPDSVVFSVRGPSTEMEAFKESLEAWADHWGLGKRPFRFFWLLNFAMAAAFAEPPKDLG